MKIQCTKKLRDYGKKHLIIEDTVEDEYYSWTANLYYNFGKKCIILMNHYSRFTVFCYNIKMADIKNLDTFCLRKIAENLLSIKEFEKSAIEKYIQNAGKVSFGSKTSRNANSQMVEMQYMLCYTLPELVNENNICNEIELNKIINTDYIMTSIKETFPYIRFKTILNS